MEYADPAYASLNPFFGPTAGQPALPGWTPTSDAQDPQARWMLWGGLAVAALLTVVVLSS